MNQSLYDNMSEKMIFCKLIYSSDEKDLWKHLGLYKSTLLSNNHFCKMLMLCLGWKPEDIDRVISLKNYG